VNKSAARTSNGAAKRRETDLDRELIDQAKKGDQQAFRELVERHQRGAFTVAMAYVHDENDARELVQEAFLRVHRGLATFQGGSAFFTWLYRIVTNLAIDATRRQGRRVDELEDEQLADDEPQDIPYVARMDGSDPFRVVRRREIAERLQAALDRLPPYHRAVVVMREVEGMSYEEIAEATGATPGTVMSRLFHARQKLQRALASCYEEESGRRPVLRARTQTPAPDLAIGEDGGEDGGEPSEEAS
jgi:RNA polymerase sigma-70 factor (ECF subfamily)